MTPSSTDFNEDALIDEAFHAMTGPAPASARKASHLSENIATRSRNVGETSRLRDAPERRAIEQRPSFGVPHNFNFLLGAGAANLQTHLPKLKPLCRLVFVSI